MKGTLKEPPVVTISYDEKPGIQALATTTPDRPPKPNQFPSHLRDYEYERLGTVSLLAGLAKTPPPKIRVCVHADTRLMAQHRRDHVQQNGAQHAAGHPRRQPAGTD